MSPPILSFHSSINFRDLPSSRAKKPCGSRRIWIRHPNSGIIVVHIVIRNIDPPPRSHVRIGQIERENNDNCRYGKANVKASRSEIIEAHPPSPVAVPDVAIEKPTNDAPGEVIERCGRGDVSCASEYQRCREIFDVRSREHACAKVDKDGEEDACEPEPLKVDVDATGRENALRANETPDDGGVEEDSSVRAGEAVLLVLGADAFDRSSEAPFKDSDLDY